MSMGGFWQTLSFVICGWSVGQSSGYGEVGVLDYIYGVSGVESKIKTI